MNRTKRAGGMAQVVEHLPRKCEGLTSDKSTNKQDTTKGKLKGEKRKETRPSPQATNSL
jgi:dihydroxyacid dehydratase/phosphogluconate dehydratase